MKKKLKECPECGRPAEVLTDKEQFLMGKGELEVVTVVGEEPCGRCEKGAENREMVL